MLLILYLKLVVVMVALILARDHPLIFFLILHITQCSSFVSLSTCLLACLILIKVTEFTGIRTERWYYAFHAFTHGFFFFFSCELFLIVMSTQLLLNLLSYIYILCIYTHTYVALVL